MAYIDGENLIATVIKAHANFDANNVAQAKWTQLDSGKSDHYAILKHGGMIPERISKNIYVARHTTVIEVWQNYLDDGSTAVSLYGYVGNVITQIEDNEKLGDTGGIIQNASPAEIGQVEEMWLSGGGPAWLRQMVSILWHEQVTAT